MTQLQEYRGRFTLTSSMVDFNVTNDRAGTQNCVINTGKVFLAGYSGEAEAASLCNKLQAALRTQSNHTNATVTYSGTTGVVTIALYSAGNIYWTDNALGYALGFTQQSMQIAAGGSQSWTSNIQPRYIWRPTRGAADMPLHVNNWWAPRSTSKLVRSVDGTVTSVQGNLLYDGRYSYRNLPRQDVEATPGETNAHRPLEVFWEDVVHVGNEIRVYPDRTASDTSTACHTGFWVAEPDAEEPMDVGSFSSQAGRSVSAYDGLWDVDFAMVKNV